ncbi:MAG TPA: ATP-binding protein [Thermomicrobiales bacterium]|nr:ATP-binding protein [Thermomicrobiales bacterium]
MSLRARLTIGYGVLFLIALLALEVALYGIPREALRRGVDDALLGRAEQVERAVVTGGHEDLDPASISADMFVLAPSAPGEELTTPGIHIRVLDVHGRALASSSAVAAQFPLDAAAFGRALSDEIRFTTITVDGTRVRMLYHPLRLGGRVLAVLQLGESLVPTERTLEQMRLLLIAGGVGALLAGLIGGWWLTHQALRPVVALTDAVARIATTGVFTERVPEPVVQDEIGRLAATFNDLLARLNQMFDRQQRLLADTSHELRNPLMVVRGNLELLAHDIPPQDRAEAIADAISEVTRMSSLVQDLLFLSDTDAGTAIEQHDVALEQIVAAIAEDAARIATREDGARSIVLEANDPLIVRGDGERLRQLLWNLVENAVRYTPPGGTVTLALRRRGPVAELTVSDTGIGIPPEHLPHIFERFYRVDTGRSRAVGGTGLGLSIVRQITEAHGGQVRVRSTPGEGSTFTVALPVWER